MTWNLGNALKRPSTTSKPLFASIRRIGRKRTSVAEKTEFVIHIGYDHEARRWYVAKSDIPGLRLEADTPHELMARIADAAPELLELNAQRAEAETRPALSWKPVFDNSLELQSA